MRASARAALVAVLAVAPWLAGSVSAQETDSLAVVSDPVKYLVIVSATKTPRPLEEIPNSATVIRGDALRRGGVRTLADALQDVVGMDTGNGSDAGLAMPNIGLWGLKEFDALLITLDGVPVGGPFNPDLAEIPVEDIDRIEIVKGPQGTLYGVSAFAGMLQVFTRQDEGGRGHLTLGGGSFSEGHADAGWNRALGPFALRLNGGAQRSDGWQDRTGRDLDHGALALSGGLGAGRLTLALSARRDHQRWGTPLPLDPQTGEIDPNFRADRNYAVGGARVDHHLWSASSGLSWPAGRARRVENTLGFTRDVQLSVTSFPEPDAATGTTVPSAGVSLRPEQNTLFDDLRVVSRFALAGRHESVMGAAVTWGRVEAAGMGFDFDQDASAAASIPDVGTLAPGDLRSFRDERTFLGAYVHDSWTPQGQSALTLAGGGRYDRAHEKLHAQAQEQSPGSPLESADDGRTDRAWSGDASALVRLLPAPLHHLEAANAYLNWKSSFKPAAPNLTEAEGASILDPERTHSVEAGLKLRALERQLGLDLSWFDLRFDNLVVPVEGPGSTPLLTNAGRERFRGAEVALDSRPAAIPGLELGIGYAHHDPRFVRFAFLTPDATMEDDSGHLVELAPRELANGRLAWHSPAGIGVFGAVRWQGRRALDRDNHYFLPADSEWDAGVSYELAGWRASVTGRNLGDRRHIVAESDLADAMFYLAPPRRVSAQVTYTFE